MLQTQGTVGRFVMLQTQGTAGRFVVYVTNTRYSEKICCICYKHKVQWEDLLYRLQTRGTVGRFVMLQTQGTVGRFVVYVTNTRYSGKTCYISYKHKVQGEDLLYMLQT